MFVPKLAISNLLVRRTRVALTAGAIALSVSLVVAVTSGYASLEAAAYKFFTHYLGTTDSTITATNYGSGVPESLIGEIQHDPRVKQAVGRFETEIGLLSEPNRLAEVIGLRRPDDTQVEQLTLEAGQWFDVSDGNEAVVDQAVARLLKVGVGGEIVLPGIGDQRLTLKIVGVVHKPDIMAEFRPTIYLPLHTLQRFKKFGQQVTRIAVELNRRSDLAQFFNDWERKLHQIDPGLRLNTAGHGREMLGQNLQVLRLASYLAGAVSMVAAMFIVFSTLSMGVTERQRTLAMLRAVGAFRRQVAALVIVEGILIVGIGVAVGVPLGAAWIHLLTWWFSRLFTAGAVISRGGVMLGTFGSLLAALAASLLPAWSASRVRPLEAMAPMAKAGSALTPWLCALGGLALVGVDPLILFGPTDRLLGWLGVASPQAMVKVVRFYCHFALGLPALMMGFFLLSPLFVLIFEGLLAPLVAALMGLRYALLRQQLAGSLWRAAGTCTALMVGLAVLIVLQTEGRTALSGWKLPDKFPDVFIVDFTGIDLADAKKLEDVPGIRKGEVMPIAVVSPGLPANFLGLMGLMMVPDRTMFIGIDPDRAFDLMQLDFREGNVTDAKRMLKMGRHVLVTTEFKQLKGLGLGDKLPLKTNHGFEDYTIAGVVWSPGIDVIVSAFDMGRQMDQRTAASVFGSLEDAQRDFGVRKFLLFAANLNYFVEKETAVKQVQQELKKEGMRAGDVRQIKYRIEQTFLNLLLLVSTVAFAAMAVAALGVTNTVMAGIRTRRWQLGILRSIGVTRWQLLRLILGEAALLGLVGCALGIAAGLEMSVNARAVQVAVTGYNPPMLIPWRYVGLGSGIVVAVSLIASLWPAFWVARTDPLELLQAGRAAT